MALPGAPTALVATAGDNQLSIAFTPTAASPAVTGYKIRIGSGGAAGGFKSVPETGSPIVVRGLKNGKSYTIHILAVNSDGDGASASTSGTPTDAVATNDNGFTDATWAANAGAAVPQLDWNDPDD